MKVYVLSRLCDYDVGEDNTVLGVYSSEEEAERRKAQCEMARKLLHAVGFFIEEYELDDTPDGLDVPIKDLTT